MSTADAAKTALADRPATAAPPPLSRDWVVRLGAASVRVRRRPFVVGSIALLVLVVAGVTSLLIGTVSFTPAELLAVFQGDATPAETRTIMGRRLPRLLTAILVGACLAQSGAVFQSISRNPLGSPDIIGFTTGAATAAVIQIVLFGGGVLDTAIAAILGGIGTALLVYLLARRDGISGGIRLVLVGIGAGSLLSSITSLLVVRADIRDATEVQLWSSGSLTGRAWPHVFALLVVSLVLLPALTALVRRVALVEMGDDISQGIGVDVERTRFLSMVVAVTLASVATAAAGPIAFVAFAAPHIVRRLAHAPGPQVWLSGLVGALLLAAADLLSQNLEVGVRTPVGLVTSLLGGFYLVWLLARRV